MQLKVGDRVRWVGTVDGQCDGTVTQVWENGVFEVRWDDGKPCLSTYNTASDIPHNVVLLSSTLTSSSARTPTLPPPPPPDPPRPPDRSQYGRCYFCARPDSEWLRDRYTCDDCMERYR